MQRRATRRASAPGLLTKEEEDNLEAEDVDEQEDQTGPGSRYPSRRRSRVDHFDPTEIYQTRPRQRMKCEVRYYRADCLYILGR